MDDDLTRMTSALIAPDFGVLSHPVLQIDAAAKALMQGGGAAPMSRPVPRQPGGDMKNYARHIEDVPISWLKRLPGNAPRLNEEQFGKLKADIEQNGLKDPLIINAGKESQTAQLGEGNHRLRALEELGYTHAPARVTVGSEWGSRKPNSFFGEDIIPMKGEYFPADARPSQVFNSLKGK